jgi:hypothetical protein
MNNGVEISISCADCIRRGTPDCSDCLVSYVVGETPESLVMSERDAQVVELFTSQGMIPRLRFNERSAKPS